MADSNYRLIRRGGWVTLSLPVFVFTLPVLAQDPPPPPVVRPGVAIDSKGGPAVDPTENVKALTAAGLKTEAELREALKELLLTKIDLVEKLSELRTKQSDATNKLLVENSANERNAEIKRIDEIAKLRAELNDKLAVAERDRINAIRLVDVSAAADLQRRTSESASNLNLQTTQLATDLRTSTALLADNLRTLVNTTASAQSAAQKQSADDVSKRLTSIEAAQSEGRGKTQFQDPAQALAISGLTATVEKLLQQRATAGGTDTGRSDMLGWIFGGFGLLIAFGAFILNLMRRPTHT